MQRSSKGFATLVFLTLQTEVTASCCSMLHLDEAVMTLDGLEVN